MLGLRVSSRLRVLPWRESRPLPDGTAGWPFAERGGSHPIDWRREVDTQVSGPAFACYCNRTNVVLHHGLMGYDSAYKCRDCHKVLVREDNRRRKTEYKIHIKADVKWVKQSILHLSIVPKSQPSYHVEAGLSYRCHWHPGRLRR